MPLVNPKNVLDNVIVLAILVWIGIMIYAKMDKEQVKHIIDTVKSWVGGKDGNR